MENSFFMANAKFTQDCIGPPALKPGANQSTSTSIFFFSIVLQKSRLSKGVSKLAVGECGDPPAGSFFHPGEECRIVEQLPDPLTAGIRRGNRPWIEPEAVYPRFDQVNRSPGLFGHHDGAARGHGLVDT